MAIEADDEILQDFLVEAGEILEQLGEQLVELEQSPEDSDLLNAVFRGFHTVKGGAGFLSLTAMVEVCHRAEDVFNLLRQGDLQLSPNLMDKFLRVLDILNDQFVQIGNGEDPTPAEPELLQALEAVLNGGTESAEAPEVPVVEEAPQSNGADEVEETLASEEPQATQPDPEGDITDEEFEALLDALQGKKAPKTKAKAKKKTTSKKSTSKKTASKKVTPKKSESNAASDEITDDEFEKLLDDLHGKGKHQGAPKDGTKQEAGSASNKQSASNDTKSSEDISDTEFDALLDKLHGKGKGPKGPSNEEATPSKPTPSTAPTKAPAAAKPAQSASATAPKPRNAAEASVRVDTKRLDDIMNMVGELVLVRNRLDNLKVMMGNEEVSKAVANLDIVTSDLQAAVMKTRMQPIRKVFGRFPRVVRDVARSLNKEVELELVGEETDLDKNLVEALADPLVHLVRNSVDHGIEMPDVRENVGKQRTGKVVLAATQEGDHILLTITDDGAGMDPDVLRKIAIDRGVMDAESAARLDDSDCYDLIFAPGFSTKSEISDISGRGVGMDVVKTRITQLNGSVEITSKKGEGTCMSIKLPLTLAILPTLMVKVGKNPFALPLSSVNEIFHLDSTRTNVVDGQLVVLVREKAMPLFYLKEWLVREKSDHVSSEFEQVVVTQLGNQRVGFVVNQVVGQEEVVIKPLGALLHGLPGFAGATITGDGRIALILDVPSLMKAHVGRR